MNSSENYAEPKASGQTGDRIDSVSIARILHGAALPVGLFIGIAGAVAIWKEPAVRAGSGGGAQGLVAILESGACLIAASGFFLVVLGIMGLMAMRRLSRR